MAEDIVRALRVIEYVGTRAAVEFTINNSIHGEKVVNYSHDPHRHGQVVIKTATIGNYPEIIGATE